STQYCDSSEHAVARGGGSCDSKCVLSTLVTPFRYGESVACPLEVCAREIWRKVYKQESANSGTFGDFGSLLGRGVSWSLASGLMHQDVGVLCERLDRRARLRVARVGDGTVRRLGRDPQAYYRDRMLSRRSHDVPGFTIEYGGIFLVMDHSPVDLRQPIPPRGIEGFEASPGLVERRLDAIDGYRTPAAGQPDFFHEEREAAHMIGMLVGDDES